jgi:hypothetical protein
MPESEETPTSSLTPILDSGVLPPVVRRKMARAGIRAIPGFIVGFVLMLAVSARADKSRDPIIGLILLVSALLLTITIHELGHLLAGWMVAFRFSLVDVGPFSLIVEHGKLKARIRREMLASGSAGMHVKTVRRLRRRLLIENSTSGCARELLKESWLEWRAEIQDRKAQRSTVLSDVV